jgi:hypothetical protein
MKKLTKILILMLLMVNTSWAQLIEEKKNLESSLTMSNKNNFDDKDGLLEMYKQLTDSTLKREHLTNRVVVMIYPQFTFEKGQDATDVDNIITELERDLKTEFDQLMAKKPTTNSVFDLTELFDEKTAFDSSRIAELSIYLKNHLSPVRIDTITSTEKDVLEKLHTSLTTLRQKASTKDLITAEDKIITKVLHTVEKDSSGIPTYKWSETLIEIDSIEILCFYDTDNPIALSLNYEELKSHFGKDLEGLVELIKLIQPMSPITFASSDVATLALKATYIKVNPSYLRAPFKLHLIKQPDGGEKDTTTVFVDERYHFSLISGISSSLLTRSQFTYSENDLTITLDSANKEEWKENLMVGFTFSLGGRTSKYAPKFRLSSYKDKENSFWKRTSLMAGCKLSTRPFDHLYLGMTHDFSKNITVMFGINQPKDLNDQTIEVGPDESVNKVVRNAVRTTGDITFFWGIAFSPTEMLKLLKD